MRYNVSPLVKGSVFSSGTDFCDLEKSCSFRRSSGPTWRCWHLYVESTLKLRMGEMRLLKFQRAYFNGNRGFSDSLSILPGMISYGPQHVHTNVLLILHMYVCIMYVCRERRRRFQEEISSLFFTISSHCLSHNLSPSGINSFSYTH